MEAENWGMANRAEQHLTQRAQREAEERREASRNQSREPSVEDRAIKQPPAGGTEGLGRATVEDQNNTRGGIFVNEKCSARIEKRGKIQV